MKKEWIIDKIKRNKILIDKVSAKVIKSDFDKFIIATFLKMNENLSKKI